MLIPELGCPSDLGTVLLRRLRLQRSFLLPDAARTLLPAAAGIPFNHRSEIALQDDHNQNIMLFCA